MISHRWDLDPKEAVALQRELAEQVDVQTPLNLDDIRLVAGVDVSVKENVSRAAIVLLTYPGFERIEAVTARIPTPFPYISGLLSFREGEVVLAAAEKLSQKPDVYIFDGAGYAHPRRIGIASHIGLWWDAPTIGCAKKRLVGTHGELRAEKGSYELLWDKNEAIGTIIRTRTNVKPVYISPGHRATIDTARELILRCTTRYRLPEPIRAAHNTAGDF